MALDQQLEKSFLARIIRDADAATIALQRKISGEVFQWSTAAKLYSIATWYTQNYGTCLSINELDGLLKKSATLSPDIQQPIHFGRDFFGAPINNGSPRALLAGRL